MTNQLMKTDSSIEISQRTRQLEERLVDARSTICIDSLLDSLVALIHDSEGLKKTKNFDTFFSRFFTSSREIREKRIQPNDFQTIKILGRGAFGTVDLVRRKQTGQVFAMKTLSKFEMLKKSDTAFFWEERNIMAFTNSEWIVKLHYAFQDAKNLYMIMDYMPGGDLITLISRYEIDENAARFYCAEIILALDAVHSMGYVHRDVKPDNLLLDSRGHLKLADFGTCVKMDEKRQVRSDTAIGTPDYISPEILKSQSKLAVYGPEVDWWSVGVVFYEMLYGETPFYEESLVGTYNKIMNHTQYLTFPSDLSISIESKKLISDFLNEPSNRLGRNGIMEIKQHPAFANQNDWTWETIRRILPPVVPKIVQDDDTSNFDEIEPEERPSQEAFTTSKTFAGNQLAFIGFSYSNDQQPFLDRRLVGTLSNGIEQRFDENQRIRRLQDELNVKCQDEQIWNKKCFELERKIVVLTTEAKEAQRKLENQLSNIHVSSDQESRQLTEKIISLENRIADLEEDLNDEMEVNRRLKFQNEKLEKSSTQYERTNEEIHDRFEEMLSEKLRLEKDLKQRENLLEQERINRNATIEQLEKLRNEFEYLSHDYLKLKNQDVSNRKKLGDFEETIGTFEQQQFDLQDEIDGLRMELSNSELARRQLQEKILLNKVQRNENFNKDDELQKIVRDLEEKIQIERENLRKTHEDFIQSQKHCRIIESELKEVTNQYHDLIQQNRNEEQRRKDFEQKIRMTEEKFSKSLERVELLTNNLKEKEKENEDLKNQQKIFTEKIQNFQLKLDESESQTKILKETIERTDGEIKQLNDKLRQEEKDRAKLLGQIELLNQKLKVENERFHRLEEENGQLEKDKQMMIIEAEAVHKDFQVRLALLDSQINTIRDQYEKAQRDFEQSNKDRQALDDEYHHVVEQSNDFERQIDGLRKRVENERANKEAVLKKLEEVLKKNPNANPPAPRRRSIDRSERNLVRRLEQTLEQEREKYRRLQNEKEDSVVQLTEEINSLKNQLENLKKVKTEVKTIEKIEPVISNNRLEGWVDIPTRNVRKGGWKRYYAMITKNKFQLFYPDKVDQVMTSIDFSQFYHVRTVTHGDVPRIPANLLSRIFQILYDSGSEKPVVTGSSSTLPSRMNASNVSNSHQIEYKGHQFLVVTYRKQTECEVCKRSCHSIFSPPACLECTRCRFRCHKSHFDNRDDPIPSCRVFDDSSGKGLIILCENEEQQKIWHSYLQTKVPRRYSISPVDPIGTLRKFSQPPSPPTPKIEDPNENGTSENIIF